MVSITRDPFMGVGSSTAKLQSLGTQECIGTGGHSRVVVCSTTTLGSVAMKISDCKDEHASNEAQLVSATVSFYDLYN